MTTLHTPNRAPRGESTTAQESEARSEPTRARGRRRSARQHDRHRDRSEPMIGWVPVADRPPELPAPAPRPLPARRRGRHQRGGYELRREPHHSTTRQGEVLNIALAARPASPNRLLLGTNVHTGSATTLDPFVSYAEQARGEARDRVTSAIVSIIGNIGMGKSTVLKAQFVLRMLLLGRHVVVLDKKRQGVEGEYAPIARQVGTEPIKLASGGGASTARINLLDPVIGVTTGESGSTGDGRPAGQLELVQRVIAEKRGAALDVRGIEALRVGLLAAPGRAAREQRVPVVSDLIWCLQHPDAAQVQHLYDGAWTTEQVKDWGIEAAATLLVLINGELAGVIDGPTSPEVSLRHPSRLTVFDISALPNSGATIGIVMLLIQTWLAGLLATRSAQKQQTVLIVEEGWHVASGGLGEMFKETAKLVRALGLSIVAGFHHPSDLPPGSPARALMQESSTLLLFGQDKPDDIAETLDIANLSPQLEGVLRGLPRGQCLLVRAGADPEQVVVAISDFEAALTNTDEQMTGSAALVQHHREGDEDVDDTDGLSDDLVPGDIATARDLTAGGPGARP